MSTTAITDEQRQCAAACAIVVVFTYLAQDPHPYGWYGYTTSSSTQARDPFTEAWLWSMRYWGDTNGYQEIEGDWFSYLDYIYEYHRRVKQAPVLKPQSVRSFPISKKTRSKS